MPSSEVHPDSPVVSVSWNDTQSFLHKLNQGKTNSELTFHLPTEAQWEYACRAGTTGPWADDDLGKVGWYTANSGRRIHPVGELSGNPFGLHDMHGNVWEWCADWFGEYREESAKDPLGLPEGIDRVFRGGVCISPPYNCRSARRYSNKPEHRHHYLGFRVIAEIK